MDKKNIVLFDLDGTLCDTGLDLALSVNHSRKTAGFAELDVELIKSFVGDGIHKLMERSLTGNETEKFDECFEEFKRHYFDNCTANTVIYPGGREALEELKGSFFLGVLTNKDSRYSEKILKELQVYSVFDDVIGGDTLNAKKPRPDGVYHFSEKFSVPVKNIYMVGDHKTDLELCVNSGATSIFCSFGMGVTGDFKPDHEISSFSELPSLLNRLVSAGN